MIINIIADIAPLTLLLFVRYDMYLPLHELWKGYMQELLNLAPNRQVNKYEFL